MPVFENKVTVESDVKRHVGSRRQPSSSTGTGSTNICRQSFYGGQDVATDHRPDSVFWRKHAVCSHQTALTELDEKQIHLQISE